MSNDPTQEPTWHFCEFCGCVHEELSHDMGFCDTCESWFCPKHGDRDGDDICAECIEGLGVDKWLSFLGDNEPLVKELKYRVRASWIFLCAPFLTSAGAVAYAATEPWLIAEEHDGERWLPLEQAEVS